MRNILGGAIGALLALAVGGPFVAARAATLRTTEYAITQTPLWETTPRLGNDGVSDLVVFTRRGIELDGSMTKGDIWYQRLVAGAPSGPAVQVTTDNQDNQLNDVSGDFIVYTAYFSTTSLSGQIMAYQISTGKLYGIGAALVIQEPRIFGTNVVWREGGANATQVMIYDLGWLGTAMDPAILAGPIPPTFNVDIGERFVVWAEQTGGQMDVVAFDLVAMVRINLTSTPTTNESEPSTSGDWIVWQAQDKGVAASRIMAMKIPANGLATGEELVIADSGVFNYRPSIAGDLVTWESMLTGKLNIFVYRLSTGETFQVTSGDVDHYLNDVFGGEVTYVDQRTGNEDIYVSTLTFVPDVTASPASYDFGAVVAFTQKSTCVNLTNGEPRAVSIMPSLASGATAPFSIDLLPPAGPAGYPIAPDETFCVPIVFAPTEIIGVPWTTELTVAAGSPPVVVATVPLQGTAIPGFGDVEVSPASLSLGDVDLGSSAAAVVTVSNLSEHWSSPLIADLLGVSSPAFSFQCVAPTLCTCTSGVCAFVLAPLTTADLSVSFKPTVLGSASATLAVTTTDQSNETSLVSLSGTGVDLPTPPELVRDLVKFVDDSVANGTLVGSGNGNSASGRLGAVRNMIRAAGDLIAAGQYARACQQLLDVYLRVDGMSPPPDFATGAAAPEVRTRVSDLRASMGCN